METNNAEKDASAAVAARWRRPSARGRAGPPSATSAAARAARVRSAATTVDFARCARPRVRSAASEARPISAARRTMTRRRARKDPSRERDRGVPERFASAVDAPRDAGDGALARGGGVARAEARASRCADGARRRRRAGSPDVRMPVVVLRSAIVVSSSRQERSSGPRRVLVRIFERERKASVTELGVSSSWLV